MTNAPNHFKQKIMFTAIVVSLSFVVIICYLMPNHILNQILPKFFLYYGGCPDNGCGDSLSLFGYIIFLAISTTIGYLLSNIIFSLHKK